MKRWTRVSPEWLAFGAADPEGRPLVYFSDDVPYIDLDPHTDEVMSIGSSTPIHTMESIDLRGVVSSFEVAVSDVSTAEAATTVGLTELLGDVDSTIDKMRPQLKVLYYACVDHIETSEQAEAFEALAEFLGV